ncbi:MAG: zinc-binding dehydrogenase [Kiritimatiellia bacterium]|nr:zinc-binding dehydrogenase [Kiritimatiellia bacterium]
MKKLILTGPRSMVVSDAPTPEPVPGDVLVQTAVSVLCGSEIKSYRTGEGTGSNAGHEAAGTVIRVGEGVDPGWIGKRVGASALSGCGVCDACRRQIYSWCPALRFHGAMHSEYFTVAAMSCKELPDSMPWDIGALVSGDGLGVPYHTNTRIQNPDQVRTIAVFGLGPIGLGNVMLQHHLGRTVIGVDLSPTRLDMARALGAQTIIRAGETDPVTAIREATGGRGADICIEAAGMPATLKACFAAVKSGGQILLNGEQGPTPLSPSDDFIRRDITATGCWFYHFNEIPAMMDLAASGLPLAKLLTHHFPAERAAEAYALFADAQTGKAALHWDLAWKTLRR